MNFQQYLYDKGFQREDLLARIAESLELDESRSKKMESAYKAIYDVLKADTIFFAKVEFVVYPQGSKPIGTTTKPIGKDEFDLDIVVQIKDPYYNYTSSEIYDHLIRVFSANEVYRPKLVRKNRCARINYAGDFHLDVLPGCIIIRDSDKLMVPDRELKAWTSSYPKGYIGWFLTKAENVRQPLLKKAYGDYILLSEGKSEQEDLPEEDQYSKKPLKRAVQITKRYRDIFFSKKPKHRTSSIVLTTIFGELYEGESSIYETIDNVLNKILGNYSDYQNLYETKRIYRRIKVLNPVNKDEDFTEKWDDDKEYYHQFIAFVKSYKEKWERLKNGDLGVAEELFGSTRTKTILSEQLKNMGKGKGHNLEKAGATIFTGNNFVDKNGNITSDKGYESKPNRNYGGIELILETRLHNLLPTKNFIAAHIQQKMIAEHFPWLKTFVSDGILYGKGKVKPDGCKKEYAIGIKYDPNAIGRKEQVFVLNDSTIQFGKTPHLYPGNSLCLYYPKDLPIHLDLNFVDVIPWISEWLVTYELWKKYGVWLAKEVKH